MKLYFAYKNYIFPLEKVQSRITTFYPDIKQNVFEESSSFHCATLKTSADQNMAAIKNQGFYDVLKLMAIILKIAKSHKIPVSLCDPMWVGPWISWSRLMATMEAVNCCTTSNPGIRDGRLKYPRIISLGDSTASSVPEGGQGYSYTAGRKGCEQ